MKAPHPAIGRRALPLRIPVGSVPWDCPTPLDG
jgi:hypothetical protein